jgi:prophage antirepressor-like protein
MDTVPSVFSFGDDNEHWDIRVFGIDGDPWFVLSDVCKVIGVSNPSDVASSLDEDEKRQVIDSSTLDLIEGSKINKLLNLVSESGLYSIILRSRKAAKPGSRAHRFRKWVTSDVLPSIRKTGKYQQPRAEPEPVVEQKTGVQIPTGIFDLEMQRELTNLVTSCMSAGMAKQEAFAYAHAVVMSWAQVGSVAPKQASSAVRHIHTDDVPADGDYADSTTIAGLVGVPAKDRMKQRRSIPFLLREAGLLEPAERSKLTAEGEKFGITKRVNGHDRIYWRKDDTVAHLRNWIDIFGWPV